MATNGNRIGSPSTLLLVLAALTVSGCAPAQFAHQRSLTRTDATLQPAASPPRQESWRPTIPAISQADMAGPPVVLNDPRQPYRVDAPRVDDASAPAVIRDVAANRTAETARRTVMRVSSSDFDQHVLAADVPVLVDFYAEWCGPCKALAPTLDQVAAENPQVRVVKVNIDDSPELAARYGVRSVPRLMVFKAGQIAAQQNGVASKSRLTAMLGLSTPVYLD